MIKFFSVAEVDAAFRAYVEEVRVEALNSLVSSASEMIVAKYRNLPYPMRINGEDVSSVPPAEISSAVRSSVGTDSGMVAIDPSMIEEEWSARRYAALVVNGNPFASTLRELEAGQIADITGLKIHP